MPMTSEHRTRRGALALAGAMIAIAIATLALRATPAEAIVAGVQARTTEGYDGSLERPNSPRGDKHVCGATLIAPRWAITAGHCTSWVSGKVASGTQVPRAALSGEPVGWSVRFGSLSSRTGGQVVDVVKFARLSGRIDPTADLALLKLARPVDLTPVPIATRRPRPGTRALILGWGFTQPKGSPNGFGEYGDHRAYPRRLREAETRIQPESTCGIKPDQLALCVGGLHGRPGPDNMDSGGPVLVQQAGVGTVIAGTVNGSGYTGRPAPSVYTDLSAHLKWIRSYLTGRRTIPAERPLHERGLAGTATFNYCSASIVRVPSSRSTDHALLLTAGHCAVTRPPRGKALSDQPSHSLVSVFRNDGNPTARTVTTRLLYATMTGTDVALYRLADTYADLAAVGAKALTLTTRGPVVGERLTMLSSTLQKTYSCRVEAVVPTLREAGYTQRESLRYATEPACEPIPGSSGAPLVVPGTDEVVAIHNTHVTGTGKRCAEGEPCEVGPGGSLTAIKGRGYAQQTAGVARCIVAGSRFDLTGPECELSTPVAGAGETASRRGG